MAIDTIARALASSILDANGKISIDKMPEFNPHGANTSVTVGNIPAGTDLSGMTIEEILIFMLYGVMYPKLTNPTFEIELETLFGAINEPLKVQGVVRFNRGSIVPDYGTSGYRAGLPTKYTVEDQAYETNFLEQPFEYYINAVQSGDNIINATVHYQAGEQPLDSAGNPYNAPYPAGSLSASAIVTGAYNIYVGIGSEINMNLEAQDIYTTYSIEKDESGNQIRKYEVIIPAELDEDNKGQIAISDALEVIGIQQYDIMTQQWDWVQGSKEASLNSFAQQKITSDILDTTTDYILYTNILPVMGERKLRFYIK